MFQIQENAMTPNSSPHDAACSPVETLLRELYAARVAGELERLCALFAPDAFLRLSGSSDGKHLSIAAHGSAEIASWLGVLVKTFRLSDQETLTSVIEGARAAVHWRASIHSRITGVTVPTELIDVFEVKAGLILRYVELFAPAPMLPTETSS